MSTRSKFDEALEDVFEERAREFSPASRALLEQLWEQGQLAGRELERQEQPLSLEKAVRSECGNYLCVPVPREMLVLEGAQGGMDQLVYELQHGRSLDTKSPMSEMVAAMDAEILRKMDAVDESQNFLELAPRPQVLRNKRGVLDDILEVLAHGHKEAMSLHSTWIANSGISSIWEHLSTKGVLSHSAIATPRDSSSDKP